MLSTIIYAFTLLFFYQVHSSEPNTRLSHPQHLALVHGTLDQLQQRFSSIEDINNVYVEGNWGDKFSPLEVIILSSDPTDKLEKTKYLMAQNIHFTKKQLKLLLKEKHESNNEILKYLLQHHSCPQLPDKLHLAVMNKNLQAVELLLENTTNINSLDRFGMTALEWCSSHANSVIFDVLLAHGSMLPTKKDFFLRSLAAEKFGYAILQSFFRHSTKGVVNNRNVFGRTPLDVAIIRDLYKKCSCFSVVSYD